MPLNARFELRADLLYSSEGGKRDGAQAIDASSVNPQAPAGSFLYATFNNESILNYAELPVLFKCIVAGGQRSKLYAAAGPYAGYLLNARQKTSGSSLIYADKAETVAMVPVSQSFNASTDVSSSIKPWNVGAMGIIGVSQKLCPGELFLEVRGAYGLTTVQTDSQSGSSHNGYLSIALGYSFFL
jgi:hypothetical protein